MLVWHHCVHKVLKELKRELQWVLCHRKLLVLYRVLSICMANSLLGKITDTLFGTESETDDDACCGVEIEEVDDEG